MWSKALSIVRNGAGLLAGLLATALAPNAVRAGAWTLPQGSGQIITTLTPSTADEAFNDSGRLQSTPRYNKTELQVLMEYGITDWLTAIVWPGLQQIDIAAPTKAQRSGLGYTEVGGRARIWQNQDWVLSGQATLRIPGTIDSSNPAAAGYTGVEADIRLLLGHGFKLGGLPSFLDVQLAQRVRTDGPPDETRIDVTLGVRTAPKWLLLAQSLNVISQGAGSGPLFPATNYHKLQMSAVYQLTPQWALQAGGFVTYAGRNALQENGLLLGTWYRF